MGQIDELLQTARGNPALVDAFGRRIDYLRLSVTDRCDLRCTYCMGEDMQFLPRRDLLTSDELIGIANAFIDRGIRRIRLTGGEPLTRRDIVAIVAALGERIGSGLDELTMTTNATACSPRMTPSVSRRTASVSTTISVTTTAATGVHMRQGGHWRC